MANYYLWLLLPHLIYSRLNMFIAHPSTAPHWKLLKLGWPRPRANQVCLANKSIISDWHDILNNVHKRKFSLVQHNVWQESVHYLCRCWFTLSVMLFCSFTVLSCHNARQYHIGKNRLTQVDQESIISCKPHILYIIVKPFHDPTLIPETSRRCACADI